MTYQLPLDIYRRTMTSTSYQMCCVEEWVNFKTSLASYIYNTLSKYLHHTLQYYISKKTDCSEKCFCTRYGYALKVL